MSSIELATVEDQRILPPQGLCSEFMGNPGILVGKTLRIKIKEENGEYVVLYVQVKSIGDYAQGLYINFDPAYIRWGRYCTYEINHIYWGKSGWTSFIRGDLRAFPDDKGRPKKKDHGSIHPDVSQV